MQTMTAETPALKSFTLATADGKILGVFPGVDANDAIRRREQFLADDRAARWAKIEVHQTRIAATKERLTGIAPPVTYTVSAAVPFDMYA